MSYHLAHHDPNSKDYESHILKIWNTDYCLGCLASKFFLIVLVPILYFWFIHPNYIVSDKFDLSILGTLWVLNIGIFSIELLSNGNFSSRIALYVSNTYFVSLILFVLFVNTRVTSPILYSLIFATPQILIYFHKILSAKEFTSRKFKFISRLLFIIGFYFAMSGFSSNPLFIVFYVLVSGFLFMKLRSLSKYRVDNDVKLDYKISFLGSWFGKYVGKDGRLISLQNFSLRIKFFILLSFLTLFIIGLIGLTPTIVCSSMTTNTILLSSSALPLVSMSSKNFCSNCGAGLKPNDRFCESCGVQVDAVQSSTGHQQPQQQYREPPSSGYQGSRTGGYQPYGGGYQRPYQQQRYGNRHSTSAPVLFGVIVFFVVLILTQNFILAIILGVVGYFGASWAESVDNPCLAFCIMDTCIDCICSATSAEMQRKGRF